LLNQIFFLGWIGRIFSWASVLVKFGETVQNDVFQSNKTFL
jgi:hypothetical protein